MALAAAGLCLAIADDAVAQTEGRVLIGPAIAGVYPLDRDLASNLVPTAFVRLRPKPGFGPAFGLSWMTLDLRRSREPEAAGKLRVRPLMAGASYTLMKGRLAASGSLVAGWSFNKATTSMSFREREQASFSVKDGPAIRPGVSLIWTAARRIAVVGSAGLVFSHPNVVLTRYDDRGAPVATEEGVWAAHTFAWRLGVAYSIF